MVKYKGMKYLKNRLEQKRNRVKTRYEYYEMKNRIKDFQISTPPELRNMQTILGWCGKAVDSLADRIVFRKFAEDNFNIEEIFAMNNPDTFFDSAVLSALISSCCFVYISEDDNGFPKLEIIDGANATGIIDQGTGLLKEGYAVLKRDSLDCPTVEAYFTAGNIRVFQNGSFRDIPNNVPYPLLVPIIFRPDAVRPFGHSRISRACMDIVNSAMRTVKRSEIAAEFFSFPQKYVVGTAQESEPLDKWKATMSSLIEITKDDEGDKPTFGQFQQQSMSPHTEQLKMFAGLFAGETGLTLDDLGFVTDNPSSAEAIKASHENLRLIARKAQRTFGTGFLNVGYLSACLRDNYSYERRQFYLTKPRWEPVFEPDAAALSSYGDGAVKINQAIPGYIDKDKLRDLTGF
ncbi:hypothetical protein [Blautia argi]|uniref:hypothetical protein n=1 Tax=Blautia argi TaxID=1912897 RepID=UPI002942DA0C|nr:hypothetical protein [Blautia argi]